MLTTLLFDLGNVLYRFEPDTLFAAFAENASDSALLRAAVEADWPSLDSGALPYADAIARAKSRLPSRLHPAADRFYAEWHTRLPAVPGMDALLARLQSTGHCLFLLSNAPARLAEVASDFPLLASFDGLLFSGSVRLTKPDPAIYRLAITRFGLDPAATLFVDDLVPNVEAAQRLGLQAFLFEGDPAPLATLIFGS